MAAYTILLGLCLIVTVNANSTQQETEKAELSKYIANKKNTINPRYRLRYHVQPPVGWMNDPNGFSFFKEEYHVFYQYYPYDSQWGPMHWGHSSSSNLVDWKEQPTALLPEKEMCFSGSAVVNGSVLTLIYTGHVNVSNPDIYNESQYLAFSTDGINFEKYLGNPVLKQVSNSSYSKDFRDPKAWKYGDFWYAVIGSRTEKGHGKVDLYKSPDLINWEYLSVIGESNGTLGYMWECPDFFELDNKYVLLISPQGMEPVGDRYKNTFQTGYIIGSFNYSTNEFIQETEFQEIDFGHDFYATQTLEKDGKRIMMAWLGMWNVTFPEAADGWAGALTIGRELVLSGNRILQKPVESMASLRESPQIGKDLATNESLLFEKTAEIILKANLSQPIELVVEGTNGGGKASLKWDPSSGKVVVDRGSNDIRQVGWFPINSTWWRIFLDTSSLELFCGEGEVVFSSRVYPDGNWKVTNLSPQIVKVDSYHLRTSVPQVPDPQPDSSTKLSAYPLLGILLLIYPLFSSLYR